MKYHKWVENDRRWVIPSCDVRCPQPASVVKSEVIRYWMIELALTSGDVQNFYVRAKTKEDALKIARGYQYLSEISTLSGDQFRLLPSTEEITDP
jgi:hypothetical protein